MSLPRTPDPRQIELDLIHKQFCDLAMFHGPLLNQDTLPLPTRQRLRTLAKLYQDYRDKMPINELIGKVPQVIRLDDWKDKTPFQRYSIINSQRARDHANFVEKFMAQQGLTIPGYNCLDFGASSCYFMVEMNRREHQRSDGKIWFGTDIPDDRVHVAKNTPRDRKHLAPAFEEYQPGGELPFKNIKFGLATMFYTLHHVDDRYLEPGTPSNVLKQVYDRLEPGGYLLILEDNIGDARVDKTLHDFVKMQDDIFYPQAPGHQRTIREWHDILKANGFEVPRVGDVSLYNGLGIMTRDAILLARKPAGSVRG